MRFLSLHRRAMAEAVTPEDVADAMKVLIDIMKNPLEKSSIRIMAAREVLDRTTGRAEVTETKERIEQLERMLAERS